jgi:hypothetical protein
MNAATMAGIALLVVIVAGVVWVTTNPTDQQTTPPQSEGQQTAPAVEEQPTNQTSGQTPQPPEEQPGTLSAEDREKSPVVLSFSMVNGWNAPQWCNDLASVLDRHDVNATVFITGEVAEQNPVCVTTFVSQGTDVGSQTYRFVDLDVVSDYEYALEEVSMGKVAVDAAGNIDSRVFRAPFGDPGMNVYPLVSSANMTADFSYTTKYGTYEGGQFVEHELVECDCLDSPERVEQLAGLHVPIIINIDNSVHPGEIESFIAALKESDMKFVSASELTGLELTAGST